VRKRDIAELLGLTLAQVKRGIVDVDTRAERSRNFGKSADTFLGKLIDSLAKVRCGSAPVTTAGEGGHRHFSPSSLAGCLMVVDLVRSDAETRTASQLTISTWIHGARRHLFAGSSHDVTAATFVATSS
jgi:hypothetical protein